jgi:hypothetical protein
VLAGGGRAHLVGDEIAQRADDNGALRHGNHQREGSVDSLMSEKSSIWRGAGPRDGTFVAMFPRNPLKPRATSSPFSCCTATGGSIWLSDDLRSREQCNYVIDFLDRARARMIELCDAT